MALIGYPFYATGAAAGATATILDPVLRTAVTTLSIRGAVRKCRIVGAVFSSDAPGLGSYATVYVGNDGITRYAFHLFPGSDGDLATEPVNLNSMSDLGGYEVNEQETISIIVYDPGAAELTSGVLYVEDSEPEIAMPTGRPVTLKFGGTNDAATTISTTGGDKPTTKLEETYNYAVIGAIVRPEDKVCQANILADANGNSFTAPGSGKIVLPHPAFVFSGSQWNQGSVSQFLQVQAATKVETIFLLIEFPSNLTSGTEKPIAVQPVSFPGQPNIASIGATTQPTVGGMSFSGGNMSLFG